MQPPNLDPDSIRRQLERILSSAGFSRSDRLSRFLQFVVEQQLAGKGEEVKESVLGTEVFGRSPGYNPRADSVVRTEAAKLRARLLEYYTADGIVDPILIELPKGGYAPVFHLRAAAASTPAS